MTGIGIGVITVGYSVWLWGYMLIKGYDVTFIQLWTTVPRWPPDKMTPDEVYPHTGPGGGDNTGTPNIVPLKGGFPQGGRGSQFGKLS